MQIKLRPDVLAYINRGNAWRDSEQLDRAVADYAEVIRLAPKDARGWRNRGMIRLYKGDNKGGLADYDKALQYDPADVYSWNNRGQAKMRLGDKAGAIADFRKALELRPDLARRATSLQTAWRHAVAADSVPTLSADRHSQDACRSSLSRTGTARPPSGHRPAPDPARP